MNLTMNPHECPACGHRFYDDDPIPQVGERATDPHTSKGRRATDVRRFSRDSQCGKLLRAFASAGQMTDAAATIYAVGSVSDGLISIGQWEGCRRRCSDLRAAGYLTDSGHEQNGRIVWQITPLGEAAYRKMRETGWST